MEEADNHKSDKPFPFLELPSEIRNHIYRMVLVVGLIRIEEAHITAKYAPHGRTCPMTEGRALMNLYYPLSDGFAESPIEKPTYGARPSSVSLLASNRMVRREAASIFYGENTFAFESTSILVPFLRDLREESRPMVRHISLSLILDAGKCRSIREVIWHTAFIELQQIRGFAPKRLSLCLAAINKIWSVDEGFRLSRQPWIDGLAEAFAGLDQVGLLLYGSSYAVGLKSKIEDDFWESVAPRILSRTGEVHEGSSLRARRIEVENQWCGLDLMEDGSHSPTEHYLRRYSFSGDL